ncbi:capsid cement protein [Oceanibaculum indicum]|uniref:DUF2190 domain-containing protein n=1 Tax=Oceanibaculum indicum P24 TaxID=1207063 RepID=K2J737_9PROT|nr:capsid cement protein [Oceanibaculum indicum]EKE70888.1 hypothetical protein P24_15134 [Oceanibaculum indicum P24]
MNQGLIKTYNAGGAIAANTILAVSDADYEVVQASAATDDMVGVCISPKGAASGGRVDVQIDGIALVKFGDTVARGKPVTADANGKAVLAEPAAAVNVRIIGYAEISAVDGDIAPVRLAPGYLQGEGNAA